jgi:hypothetical protein
MGTSAVRTNQMPAVGGKMRQFAAGFNCDLRLS